MPETDTRWLDLENGDRIAYCAVDGSRPGVMFFSGYSSEMTGTKATWLDQWCRGRGRAFVRFDYRGHGQSSGRFEDGTIGGWTRDALSVLDRLTEGPQILVGSSMGGWIMLNVALERPDRVAGLVGIAAGPDFSQDIWWSLSRHNQDRLDREGRIMIEEDGESLMVTRSFIRDGREHLVMRGPIRLAVPVRLLHGMQDAAVDWSVALGLAERLTTGDVRVHLVKDGDHRLSRECDLELLGRTLDELEPEASAARPSR